MPVPDFESYKVGAGELSSASKQNNMIQAFEDELNDIDADQIAGYPGSVAAFLRGDGSWAGAFSTYVPVWASLGTAPALGNGTLTGRYLQVGKLVFFTLRFTAGSTTTFGTGTYTFSLPVAAVAATNHPLGNVLSVDTSAGLVSSALALISTGTAFSMSEVLDTHGQNVYGQTVPWTWANTDTIFVSGTYEAA